MAKDIKKEPIMVSHCHKAGWTLIVNDIIEKEKKVVRDRKMTCNECGKRCDLVEITIDKK